jgi:PAS domain S-box-containing protein
VNLRRKASLVILLLTLGILLALTGLSDRVLLGGFLRVESDSIRNRMMDFSTILLREADTLAASARHDATRDETAEHLRDPQPGFVRSAIARATVMPIDGFYLFDRDLAARLALARGPAGEMVEADPGDILHIRELARAALDGRTGASLSRVVREGHLLLVAACVVRPTSGDGVRSGVLIHTRSFSPAALDALLRGTDVHISVHGPDESQPPDVREAARRISPHTPTWSAPLGDERIAGYLRLAGAGGASAGLIRIETARDLLAHGRRTLQIFLLALAAVCALFGIPAAWLVDRLVRTDIARREGEERFRAVTESARDAIFAVRGDRIVSWNRGAGLTFGHASGDILGRSPSGLFPPELNDEPAEALSLLRAPATDPMLGVPREVWALRRNGQEFPAEISVGAWNTRDGEFRSVILRDITDRRRNEAALRASETKYRIISDHTSDWELWTAPDGRLLYTSPSCEQITGRPAHAFLDDPDLVRRIVHADDLPLLAGHCGHDASAGRVDEIEFRILHRDGGVRWIAHTCLRVYDDEGTYLGIRTSNRDITARRRAEEEKARLEEQIRTAQKLESLGVLAGGIAHDFNNLLVGVLGNAELALDADLPASVRDSLEGIRSAGSRAADLVRQMLAYSGRTPASLRPIDVDAVLRDSMPFLRAAIGHRIELDLAGSRGTPPVEADPAQIQQMALNLIVNAAESFGERTGTVRVRIRCLEAGPGFFEGALLRDRLREGPYVAVEVEDEGCGIADAELPRIFDPFFSTKFTGRGLGLPVVLGIVRAHHGNIRIRTAPQRGTCVTAYLPAAGVGGPAGPASGPPAIPFWKGSGLVLVIDDEDLVRDVARRMIERMGFQVIAAGDGVEGIRLFRERAAEIRAVVLDLTMPRMDGEATLREIRAIRRDVSVILASGFTERDVSAALRNDPAVLFLQKPFRQPLLVDRLRKASERSSAGPTPAAPPGV